MILAAGSLWGTMGLFIRSLSARGLGTMEIVALRSVLTALIVTAFVLIYNRKLMKIRLRDVWCFVGTGCCSILFFNFCYFQAIMLSTLAAAATLLYTAPIFVAVLSAVLFKEKMTPLKIASIFLAFAGCLMVTGLIGQSVSLSAAAVLAGLGAGFGYALYSIFGRYAIKRGYSSFTITVYTFIAAAIGALPLANLKDIVSVFLNGGAVWAYSLLFSTVTTILPYMLYTIGLRYTHNWKAAVIASIEPVVAACLGIFVFREKTTLIEIIGMLTVIAAMLLTSAGEWVKPGLRAEAGTQT